MSDGSLFARARATGRLWNTALVFLDASVVVAATVAAYYLRFDGIVPPNFARWIVPLMAVAIVVYGTLFWIFGQYRLVLRYVGVDTLLKLSAACLVGLAILTVVNLLGPQDLGMRPAPLGVLLMQAVLVFLGASAVRMTTRVFLHLRAGRTGRRILILGAGSAGSLLLREIQNRPDLELSVVGFLDDETVLRGRTINGVPVLGTTADLVAIAEKQQVEEVFVALPSAPQDTVRAILNAAADAGLPTRIMPSIVIERGSVSIRDLRAVDVEDLLGREPTPIDVTEVRDTIAGKVVAVTGAAGSIGSELCRQIMHLGPSRLVLIEIDESRLYELWLELHTIAPDIAEMSVCDIRDARTLGAVMDRFRPQLVLHAAAYKHVPLMELSPAEAIKTNVLGTLNVIEAAENAGVERFVLISTDKAVEPVNIMGLTKALAERVVLDAMRASELNAVAVRFGNVLGSRGSVVPIFEEQLRHGGPLTVTSPEVTRFFMTIPEAARLVLQAQAIGQPGDIFVLEMGDPVRIVDLARRMIALSGVPADIEFIGLRPGEKLHETLINESEALLPSGREKIARVDRVVVPPATFAAEVRTLAEHAETGDEAAIVADIETLEPGFGKRQGRGVEPSS